MNKQKASVMIVILCMIIMVFGCEKAETKIEKKETQKEQLENVNNEIIKEDAKVDGNKEEDNKTTTVKILKIYYVDSDTAEIKNHEIESTDISPEIIWDNLKNEGVLTEQCKLNQSNVDKEKKKIDIDVNSEFGNYIRSMGTTGEEEILVCIIRSYLETYNFKGIKITENGEPLDTGHTIIDGYMNNEE